MRIFVLITFLLLPFGHAQAECRYLSILSECLAEAHKGNPIAQFVLGSRYERGDGVEQNYREAASWYLKAAEQGDRDAQYHLGLMHYHGRGMKKAPLEAYMWFEIAAANGYEEARSEITSLDGELSPAMVQEAQNRARAWMRAYPGDPGE